MGPGCGNLAFKTVAASRDPASGRGPAASMKRTCLTAIACFGWFLAAGSLRAFTARTADDGTFITWPPARTVIFYRVGAEGRMADTALVEDMGRAFAEWEEKSRGEITFVYEGEIEASAAVRDGHNTLIWVSGVWTHGPEIAALSTVWHSEETGLIEEVDIEFNARDYDWNLPDSPDLLETSLHEIGHLLGIGHSFNPGAVMHDNRSSGTSPRRALTRDDFEALSFLHPRQLRSVLAYDLPVLFYPRYFPGEDPVLPPPSGLEAAAGGWVTALGSIDLTGDGSPSELLTAVRDEEGGKFLQAWGLEVAGENIFREHGLPRWLSHPGEVRALAGVDYDRDGTSGEAAVLIREGGEERLLFCRWDHFGAGPEAALSLAAPPADNLLGMAALDAAGTGFRDSLILLRAYPGRYSLLLHRVPDPGESNPGPDPGIEIPLPGLQEGSRILTLAALDAEGTGRDDDLVLLELDRLGDYWLHLFRLSVSPGGPYDVSYRKSVRLPSPPGAVHPGRVTGLDLKRDGFYNQLIFLAPGK